MRIYDKDELIALVQKAMGEQNIKSFAEKAGLSKDYVSRLLMGRFEDSPRRGTLEKIASATELVNFDELLQAAGYDKESIPNNAPSRDSKLKASILSSLTNTDLFWSVEGNRNNYSLSIKCNDCPFEEWNFIFLDSKGIKSHKKSSDRMFHYYLNFLFRKIPSSVKISFATNDKEEYELYKKHIPVNLSLNISLILIDTRLLKVSEEMILSTSGNNKAENIIIF